MKKKKEPGRQAVLRMLASKSSAGPEGPRKRGPKERSEKLPAVNQCTPERGPLSSERVVEKFPTAVRKSYSSAQPGYDPGFNPSKQESNRLLWPKKKRFSHSLARNSEGKQKKKSRSTIEGKETVVHRNTARSRALG